MSLPLVALRTTVDDDDDDSDNEDDSARDQLLMARLAREQATRKDAMDRAARKVPPNPKDIFVQERVAELDKLIRKHWAFFPLAKQDSILHNGLSILLNTTDKATIAEAIESMDYRRLIDSLRAQRQETFITRRLESALSTRRRLTQERLTEERLAEERLQDESLNAPFNSLTGDLLYHLMRTAPKTVKEACFLVSKLCGSSKRACDPLWDEIITHILDIPTPKPEHKAMHSRFKNKAVGFGFWPAATAVTRYTLHPRYCTAGRKQS